MEQIHEQSENTEQQSPVSRKASWKMLLVIAFLGITAVIQLVNAILQFSQQNIMSAAPFFGSFLLAVAPTVGLYRRKTWARLLQLALSLLLVIMGLLEMFAGGLFAGMIKIVPNGLVAIYLLSDECRDWCKQP